MGNCPHRYLLLSFISQTHTLTHKHRAFHILLECSNEANVREEWEEENFLLRMLWRMFSSAPVVLLVDSKPFILHLYLTYWGRYTFKLLWRHWNEVNNQHDVMNTSAVKCRITSKSACSGDFGHGIYKGYSYSSSLYRNHEAVNDSPILRKHPIHNSFDNWHLVSLTSPEFFCDVKRSNFDKRIFVYSWTITFK